MTLPDGIEIITLEDAKNAVMAFLDGNDGPVLESEIVAFVEEVERMKLSGIFARLVCDGRLMAKWDREKDEYVYTARAGSDSA